MTFLFLISFRWISSSSVCAVCDILGHLLTGLRRKFGPFHQVLQVESSLAVNPRVGRSAGLISPGQCLHESLWVKRRISSTRWPMYCFHTRSFLIQQSVFMESVHITVGDSMPRDLSLFTIRAKINAPNNSRRGMVCLLTGVTLDLEATSQTVRVRKWSQDRKWSRTANDPQIGPQMIPDRKWSLYWTANDPDQKIRNGMDDEMVWIGNWCE